MVVQSLARGWSDQQHLPGDHGPCPTTAEKHRPHKFAVPQRRPPTPAMVEWRNTFNVRPALLNTLRARRNGLRQGAAGPGATGGRGGGGAGRVAGAPGTPGVPAAGASFGAARSLDLLRVNLQSAINKDIQAVLNKYMERFFQPAMDNIRVNLGLDCEALLLEEQVRVVLQRVLEEAKLMYTLRPPPPRRHRKRSRSRSRPAAPGLAAAPAGPAHQEQAKQPVPKVGAVPAHPLNTSPPPATLQQMFKKRKEMDAEAEARRKRARLAGPIFATVSGVQVGAGASAVPAPNATASLGSPAAPTMLAAPVAPATPAMAQSRLSPGPAPPAVIPGRAALGVLPTPAASNPPVVNYLSPKWDPARITPDTMFVMGARANKVLGYETSRGRLYTKHQDLFKYASDQEDKEWLARNQLIQPTGGKAFMCILQDIHELAVSQEYKDNPLVNLLELKGFRAPDFLLKKIRAYMRNLRTEPLDDLSGLLEMDLLQEDGVTTIDDSSLMELALEYGVTLMSDDTSPSPSPAAAPAAGPAAPMSPEAAEATTAGSSSIPVEASMAAAADGPALATTAASGAEPAAASNPAAASSGGPLVSSTPASPGGRGAERGGAERGGGAERAKGLIRSQSLPAPAPFMMESLALEELELYIKSHSVEDAHFEHIMTTSSAEAEAADAEADAEGDGALDASLDASLEANLDANLDLNLDVNLDVSGTEHSQLELAWDFIGELNTPTHSPSPSVHASEETDHAHEFPSEGPVAEDAEHGGGPVVTAPSAPETLDPATSRGAPASGETSLAMSHATLTALLSGNTLEGLDIPDGLL